MIPLYMKRVDTPNIVDLTSVSLQTDPAHLTVQQELGALWAKLIPAFPRNNIHIAPSIETAVKLIRTLEQDSVRIDVLVCGSLHLVGGVIEVAGLTDSALGQAG